jgi:D-alanyl-D-alanine carboxypeptidase/D-alanyl-D-alanine-endopeptidase (penicillin-binding protein 4)
MRAVVFLMLLGLLYACSPAAKLGLKKAFKTIEENSQHHTGFMLYDVDKKKTIYEYNAARYFTPASNTKIFTFYTSLRILGDSVPALKYIERNDSLIFWGTGDPSFLNKFTFNNSRVYNFLTSSRKNLFFSSSNFNTTHFGAGWAWDDYNSAYSPERCAFPLYSNNFTIDKSVAGLKVIPPFFKRFLSAGERKEREEVVREYYSNQFKFHPGLKSRNKLWEIPMKLDQQLTVDLLADTLKKRVTAINIIAPPLAQPYYSIPTDSLYRVMMQDSDNFIAEQLLLMCADVVRDTLKTEISIKYSNLNYLDDLPDEPVWVDGSGLSRYNLFTPRSIVKLWQKIYEIVPRERLFLLLATGGVNGTIKNWYKADSPYIFGKTGTLSNNHTVSGYLVTKSGKTLIFSFMNNNYVQTTNEIRKTMQTILQTIHEKY